MNNQKALITANNLNTKAFNQSQDLVQSALSVRDEYPKKIFISAKDMIEREQEIRAKYKQDRITIMEMWIDSQYNFNKVQIHLECLQSFGIPVVMVAEDKGNGRKEACITVAKGFLIEYRECQDRVGIEYLIMREENVR